jgi:hypothetical protein
MTDEDSGIPREYADKYERQDADAEAGLVRCDSFCGAKDEPVTLEEFEAAYEHWRHHGYLSGCAHGS